MPVEKSRKSSPRKEASAQNPDEKLIESLEGRESGSLSAQELADLVGALGQLGRHEEASLQALRLLAVRPLHRRALRALSRFPAGDVDIADAWRQFAARNPADKEAPLHLARMHLSEEAFSEALEASGSVLAIDPADWEALQIRVLALAALGRAEEAGDAWRTFHAQNKDRARRLLDRLLASPSSQTEAHFAILGKAHLDGALLPAERKELERIAANELSWAYSTEVAGRDGEAASHFLNCLRLLPSDSEARDGLARTRKRLVSRLEEADDGEQRSSAAFALIKLDPPYLPAFAVLAEAALEKRDWAEAVESMEAYRAAGGQLSPDQKLLHAGAAARAGMLETASAAWNDWVSGASGSEREAGSEVEDLLLRLWEAKFDSAVAEADWDGARSALQQLAAMPSDGPPPERLRERLSKVLASAAGNSGEPDIEILRHRFAVDPAAPGLALKLGRGLMRERRYDEARPVWEYLAGAAEGQFEPWLQLARCARKLGRADEAQAAASKALEIDPSHEEAKTIAGDSALAERSQ